MRLLFATLACAGILGAQPHVEMVDGIKRYLVRATAESPPKRAPSRAKLRKMLGVVDERVNFADLEVVGTSSRPALLASTAQFEVYAVRWPVLNGINAEGLWFKPRGRVTARVVTIPDAGELPENLRESQMLAAAGAEVLSPVILDREHTWSGNPVLKKSTTQGHREFVYRMAFEVGRHPLGYETQKVLAAVDWLTARGGPVAVLGHGDGGAIALFAAVLDDRITAVSGRGFFGPDLWKEPLDRNIFGLLKDFGDAEIDKIIAPRPLCPDVAALARALRLQMKETAAVPLQPLDATARMHRDFEEMVEYTQQLARISHRLREGVDINVQRQRLWNDVIGRLPKSDVPINVRQRQAYQGTGWTGFDVTYDVAPDVIGYGVLLVPNGIPAGERRPVVVAQHGLQNKPQDMFDQPESDKSPGFRYYQNIGNKLVARGYVVYLPQNPYTGDFRPIQRLANPLGLSLFSFIIAQHDRALDFLSALPYVDPKRIGFYGLSYGGKTALRVPAMLDRYAFSICSGDFNEWVHKVVTVDDANSYMFLQEYEMPEFDLASVANHAEMAMMIAPRPFMVERGHRDGVGLDEWVGFEYAKVKRYYDEQGIGDRTEIEWFNGPHMMHCVGTLEFIRKWFGR